jgi:hypothetical protein
MVCISEKMHGFSDLWIADDAIKYQLGLRKKELVRLCAQWQAKVRAIPCEGLDNCRWGPSEADLHSAAASEVTNSADPGMSHLPVSQDPSEEEDGESGSGEDQSLTTTDDYSCDDSSFGEAESVAFTDLYSSRSVTPESE